jgi:cytochrome P450
MLRLARRNLLEMWEEADFQREFMVAKLLNRRFFVCNSPETVETALSAKNASFERKSPQMRHALKPLIGDGLFISDGDVWRTRRRIVAPIVHISRMAQFAPTVVETALEARERWAGLETLDALGEMAQLTAEIICRTIFGRELGRQHARDVVSGFADYQRVVGQIDLISLLGLPDWLPRWQSPALRRSVRRIHGVLDGIVASYRAKHGTGEPSVIGLLLDAKDPETGQPLDDEAVRNEAAVIFMAGHETTANSLAWVWYLLSQAPDVEARLHAELDTVLGGRPPTLADVPRLVYTRAIFEETIRLYPPVPILSREALQDETIKRRRVPKGSIILVVPWLLHRHKKLWEAPDHFRPERFMPGGTRAVSRFAYIPFSIGPRICPGMAFGTTEAILCLATLAQSFKLRLQPGHRVEPICRLTLRPGKSLPMTVRAREAVRGEATRIEATTPAEPTRGACPFGHG